MGNSLSDQFLKAGLVNKQQAHKANKSKGKKNKQARNSKESSEQESTRLAKQAQSKKMERDRELNAQRKAEAEEKAVAAQIRQLIEMNHVALKGGEVDYNFSDGSKIKRILVTESIQRQLGLGRLAIVKLDGNYSVVPKGVADKIGSRDESYLIPMTITAEITDEDDPYSDYEIPDDLMW